MVGGITARSATLLTGTVPHSFYHRTVIADMNSGEGEPTTSSRTSQWTSSMTPSNARSRSVPSINLDASHYALTLGCGDKLHLAPLDEDKLQV